MSTKVTLPKRGKIQTDPSEETLSEWSVNGIGMVGQLCSLCIAKIICARLFYTASNQSKLSASTNH